jgi:hypothetical protein
MLDGTIVSLWLHGDDRITVWATRPIGEHRVRRRALGPYLTVERVPGDSLADVLERVADALRSSPWERY